MSRSKFDKITKITWQKLGKKISTCYDNEEDFRTKKSVVMSVPQLKSKVGDIGRGWLEGFLFNSYSTEV